MTDAWGRAKSHVQMVVDSARIASRWKRRAREAPGKTRRAMGLAVTWWLSQAQPRIPVRGSRNEAQKRAGMKGPRYRREGRGFLRKSTGKFVVRRGLDVSGGITMQAPYAIWLLAGTRRIAGGRVLSWRPGMPTIKSWPAKKAGGGPRGELPIVIPWLVPARGKLIEYMRKLGV